MKMKLSSFSSEFELSKYYSRIIQDAIIDYHLNLDIMFEVQAPGCVPDVILFDKRDLTIHYLVAFELKLSNWKRAVYQAFRNRNFGNESYVILDNKWSGPAIKNIQIFQQYNIGLITLESNGKMRSWYNPTPTLPFSKEFSYKIACALLDPKEPKLDNLDFLSSTVGEKGLSNIKALWHM